jgi:hypothetical protein
MPSSHLLASSRASSSIDITSSTFPGSMIASHENGGEIDSQTVPRTTVTTTVASTPAMPLTRTLRGVPIMGHVARPRFSCFSVFMYFSFASSVAQASVALQDQSAQPARRG